MRDLYVIETNPPHLPHARSSVTPFTFLVELSLESQYLQSACYSLLKEEGGYCRREPCTAN
jgi:hypothetical protein